jgi:hypothetical protein
MAQNIILAGQVGGYGENGGSVTFTIQVNDGTGDENLPADAVSGRIAFQLNAVCDLIRAQIAVIEQEAQG